MTHDARVTPELRKYLAEWIQAKSSKLFRDGQTHLVLDDAAASASRFSKSRALGQLLCNRLARSAHFERHPVLFELLAWDTSNAFAVWPQKCDGVLVTSGLLARLSKTSSEASNVLKQLLRTDPTGFFAHSWTAAGRTEAQVPAVAALIERIGFAFLVHHEMAHVGLGHECTRPRPSVPQRGAQSNVPADDGLFISELDQLAVSATSHVLKGSTQASLETLATEADADLNALIYTLDFVEALAADNAAAQEDHPFYLDADSRAVFANATSRTAVTLVAIFLALMALISDEPKFEALGTRTHPPLPARVFVLFTAAIGAAPGLAAKQLWDVITTTVLILGFQEMRRRPGADKPPTPDELFARYGVTGLQTNIDQVEVLYRSLVETMGSLDKRLQHHRRFGDDLRVRWF